MNFINITHTNSHFWNQFRIYKTCLWHYYSLWKSTTIELTYTSLILNTGGSLLWTQIVIMISISMINLSKQATTTQEALLVYRTQASKSGIIPHFFAAVFQTINSTYLLTYLTFSIT